MGGIICFVRIPAPTENGGASTLRFLEIVGLYKMRHALCAFFFMGVWDGVRLVRQRPYGR